MIGEVQYGGRVTDDFDKRLLNTYAHVWFTDALFQDSFKFYTGYQIPRCAQIADFRAAIEELPLTDTPEVSIHHIMKENDMVGTIAGRL
jgi:dynein heavy chain